MNVDLHERLARRFALALVEARRDYPSLGLGAMEVRSHPGRSRRLVGVVAGVGLVAVLAIGGLAVVSRLSEPAGPPSSPPQSAAATIPPTIDGQKVYTLAEMEQQSNSGTSFLLRAYAQQIPVPCPAPIHTPSTRAELDLVPDCGTVSLVPVAAGNTTIYFNLAPRTRDLLTPWLGGPEIVIRVHAHDSGAADCGADFFGQCQSALVVEAVVWPLASASPSLPVDKSTPTPLATTGFGATGSSSLQGDHVVAWLQITNGTGGDDTITSVTSTSARSAGMYAFPACTAPPSGKGDACSTPWPIPKMTLRAGETGSAGLILRGFAHLPANGDLVSITLHFADAAPITVEIPVTVTAATSVGP